MTARDMAGVLKPVSQDFKGGYAELETSLRKDIEADSQRSRLKPTLNGWCSKVTW